MPKQQKIRVAVIFGGRSGEHEVSLMSARSVLSALDAEKYDVYQIGIGQDGEWLMGVNVLEAMTQKSTGDLLPAALMPDSTRPGMFRIRTTSVHGETLEPAIPIDVVFPVLHGTFGEDGTLQGLLELQGAAYVGAGVLGSALGMDKGVFHAVMTASGIPVLDTVTVLRTELEAGLEAVMDRVQHLGFPLFVKPANLGSSVGITKCNSRGDLVEGLMEAARFDRRIVVQKGIEAREIEVSVLGNDQPEASVPGEVLPSREFYSYEAKYIDGSSGLLIPAPISAELVEQVRSLAVKAYQAIDCAGMARVDFLLDKNSGELYLNEVNTIPGFTTISMYPKLWEASGLPYPALLDRLIELAMERKADRDRTERKYSPA